ncbi:MAG: chemotaxis protein CheW [Desulfomonilaceae bacterium]
MSHFLLFEIDGQPFALNLSYVERVVSAVKIIRIPSCDQHLLGLVDVQGNIIPVINTRKLLGFDEREIELSDQFIITRVGAFRFILVVDLVSDITPLFTQDILSDKSCDKFASFIYSSARFGGRIVLVLEPSDIVKLIQ